MNALIENNRSTNSGDKLGSSLLHLIEEYLKMKHWGFSLTHTNFKKTSGLVAIYDSGFCRISFTLSKQQTPQYDEISVEYGRLHAINEEPFMEWQGEKCHCWHTIFAPLRFLDGLSPYEAVQQAKVEKRIPRIVEGFRKSQLGEKLFNEYPPKAAIALHSVVWNHYGQRLFDLFDLRKPKLWEQYRVFLKEYYRLLGTKTSFGPPYENVC